LRDQRLKIDNEGNSMKHPRMNSSFAVIAIAAIVALASPAPAHSQPRLTAKTGPMVLYQATALPASDLIQPEELVTILRSPKAPKPLILYVGFHTLYVQAHIPGSEYVGAASRESGIQQLRKRVASLPRGKFIVIYCGCCPWSHCPNVKPADDALRAMGFTRVKVLYIANNFGANWASKGYPMAQGE
jgi:thiosulfate/3-mercaptopyruvate sulfurtransferase